MGEEKLFPSPKFRSLEFGGGSEGVKTLERPYPTEIAGSPASENE
jgi:hypothetical protein